MKCRSLPDAFRLLLVKFFLSPVRVYALVLINNSPGTRDIEPEAVPTDYYGISFDAWLDIFLEYALISACQGQAEEAYDTLGAAGDASIWYHSKPHMRQIYVCWFSK